MEGVWCPVGNGEWACGGIVVDGGVEGGCWMVVWRECGGWWSVAKLRVSIE